VSLAVHELRTPATVVAGYLRMLLKDRVGPLSDDQRRLVDEAEKSCTRISALLAEMSDLAHFELGDATLTRQTVDLPALLREVVEGAAPGPDLAAVTAADISEPADVSGDVNRLRAALAAILRCIQRELPTSSIEVRLRSQSGSAIVAIGTPESVSALARGKGDVEAAAFDELRGGMGMALPLARRVIERHGGRLAALPDNSRAGAVVVLPLKRA
jgi:signal transduction histidine kinase